MRTRALGRTERQIPVIGLGTWRYQGGIEPLLAGIQAGACLIDTAESYGTEEIVGRAMAGQRDSVFLATKVSARHLRRAELHAAAEGSLRRLGVEVIDLYQVHEPNPAIPVEETMVAMEELVEAGKIRHIGVCNFSVRQLERAARALRKSTIVSNQVRYHLADRTIEPELIPYCASQGITIIAYSPLGKVFGDLLARDPTDAMGEVARDSARSRAQVAVNWCLHTPGVVAIPKGSSVEHVLDLCHAGDWELSPEQASELRQRVRYHNRSALENWLRRRSPASMKALLKAWVNRLRR